MRVWSTKAVSCGALILLTGGVVQADVFLLDQGGRIAGEWLNRDRGPDERYEIALEGGGHIFLEARQVQQTIASDASRSAYERMAANSADTVDGQWQAAQWCRQRGLHDVRQRHLERVLELDPDHAPARYALGYGRFRGQWLTREEVLESRGYSLSQGQWLLPQQIQLNKEQQQREQSERAWFAQLRRWRQMMGSEAAAEAYRGLAEVQDPLSVSALRDFLRAEPYRQVKMLYVEALGRVADPAAVAVLVQTSLTDPDEEIFHACLACLVKIRPPHVSKSYLGALKDNNNVRLNRAASALGQLGDFSCVSPLVDALITTHTIVVPGQSDAYTATFVPAGNDGSPRGGSGLSAGRDPLVIPWTVANEQVLQALIRLNGGVNFGFDQRAWNFWLANETRARAPDVQARREDP